MVDMSQFIAAKSDQLNADDLMDAPRTITITKVTAAPDAAEQPVSIHYEGGEGRPWKPCKTMRRLLVGVWGKDASKYVGRSLTLYRDPAVAFGGLQVGGIRVSHMSHLEGDKTVALMVTRGRKAPFKVRPLTEAPRQESGNRDFSAELQRLKGLAKPGNMDALGAAWQDIGQEARKALAAELPALKAACTAQSDDVPFDATSGPDDEPDPNTNDATGDGADDGPIAATLVKIANAASIREVDAIDKDSEADRTFLPEALVDRLDEALASKRAELRAAEAKTKEPAK